MEQKLITDLKAIKLKQMEIVRSRGYKIPEIENKFAEYTAKQIKEMYSPIAQLYKVKLTEVMSNVYVKNNGEVLLVYYLERSSTDKNILTDNIETLRKTLAGLVSILTKNINKVQNEDDTGLFDYIYQYLSDYIDNGDDLYLVDVMLIHSAPIHGTALTTINTEVSEYGVLLEIFSSDVLLLDVHEHVLVSKHTMVEDTENLLKSLRIDKNDLSTIKTYDPQVNFYGLKPGTIVKIERNYTGIYSASSKGVYYRLVVE